MINLSNDSLNKLKNSINGEKMFGIDLEFCFLLFRISCRDFQLKPSLETSFNKKQTFEKAQMSLQTFIKTKAFPLN